METNDLYIKSLSYSQLRTFITNSWEWANNKLLGIYDNTVWVASATGTILHKFVEIYLKTGNVEDAIGACYKCLYDGPDGNTYLIDPSLDTKVVAFQDLKQHFKTKVIDFKKTGSNEEIMKNVKSWIEAFLSEQIDYGDILGLEKNMSYDVVDVIGGNMEVRSPVAFQAISDEVCRTNKERVLLLSWELQTIPAGSIFIEDTKFKSTHGDMNAEDPGYIFQAFFNYYCVKAEFGEAPAFIIFREIKTSKNKDGSSQHQTITIPFFGNIFEEYKVYFWRYILESFERIRIIQDRDFLFNIFDMYNSWKEWEKQKAYYLWVPVGQLKSRIAMTQKNKIASNVPVMGDRDPFQKARTLKKWEVPTEDLSTIENKIRIAFQNFGVVVKYEKVMEWYAFDQYLFHPARGITMFKICSHLPEIIQALEMDWIRIEAPVLWTKFIGVEIPREDRKFAKLEKAPKDKRPLLPIGIDVKWEETFIDLSDSWSPHLIVAGKTWSGKSEFIKSAIFALKNKWEIIIIDPKRVWLSSVKSFASEYYVDIEQIEIKLACLRLEMEEIYSELETLWAESIYEEKVAWKFRRKFIFIDEFASLAYATLQKEVTGKRGLPEVVLDKIWERIITHVLQITNLWRAAGIHLILATQRPDIKVIPGNIKANISTRVCFALASQVDSKVVLDDIGAEKLLGKGDMLFKNEGNMKRLQWFYI